MILPEDMKLFLIVLLGIFALAHGFFSSFPKCVWDNPNLEECLTRVFEVARPFLKKPIFGLPGIEPINVKAYPIEVELPNLILKATATKIIARGLGDIQLTNIKIDRSKKMSNMTMVVPVINVTSDYSWDYRHFEIFGVNSTGKFKGSFHDVKINIMAHGKLVHKDRYVTITDLDVKISFGKKTNFSFDCIEGGTAAKLVTLLINVIPDNIILLMLKSFIDEAAGRALKPVLNYSLDKLPLHLIFPSKSSSVFKATNFFKSIGIFIYS